MSEGFEVPRPPGIQDRPATVTAATWLLVLVAILYAVNFVITVTTSSTLSDAYRVAYEGTPAEGTEGSGTAGTIGGGVLSLLFGIGLAVLAVLNHRGKNPARIVTWVLGGIALCCGGGLLALNAALSNVEISEGGPTFGEIQETVYEMMPSWYQPVTITVSVVGVLALALALLLLALPPSNTFFRKPQEQFEPPPPPTYPPVG